MKTAWFFILLLVCLSSASHAFDISGIQPVTPNGIFSVFSAESLQRKQFSAEIVAEKSKEPDFYRFSVKSAYGVTDALEINLTAPYVDDYAGGLSGFEDISLGLKHRFYDEGKYGPSLAYYLTGSLPSGRNDFSTEGRYGIGFIVSKRVGPFRGHMNLFYVRPGTEKLKDEISLSGGIEFAAAHNFNLIGEIFTKKGHYSDHYDQMETRFGYRIKTTENIFTTLGLGLDLKRRTPEYRIVFAVSLVSSQKKKEIKKIVEEE